MTYYRINRRQSQGISLVISLVLVVIMAMMAAASMRGTQLEERMSGNLYDRELAFQSTENTLREAETLLQSGIKSSAFNGTNGLYPNLDPNNSTFVNRWDDSATNWKQSANQNNWR